MINTENLNKLYESIINKDELTTKHLKELGFNSRDLNTLIDENQIERIKRGLYEFKDVEKLFHFGKYLISLKQYDLATECFNRCFEIDPNHRGTCFQLFLRSIKAKDYEKAFEYFDKLKDSDNKFYNLDHNYYLYLLSSITEVPDKYKEYVKSLTKEDIRVSQDDLRYKDIPLQNKLRMTAFDRKFPYALKQQKDLITMHQRETVQDLISRELLAQAAEKERLTRIEITSFAKEENCDGIIQMLVDKSKSCNLSLLEEALLSLAKVLKEIKETSKIPKCKSINANTLFEAIDNNNFGIALRLCKEFNKDKNINDSALEILLSDICNYIISLKEVTQTPKTKTITFATITNHLLSNHINEALDSLREYMASIGKDEYTFVIIGLIRISLEEKDIAFTKPMIELSKINKNDYKFDISTYIQEFYIALSNKQFKIARIYLDIINKAKTLGVENIETLGLYQVLDSYENTKPDIKETKTPIKEENITPVVETTPVKRETIPAKVSKVDATDVDKMFLDSKCENLLKYGGVTLLKPMNDERIDILLELLKGYKDIEASTISNGRNSQIVLRYRPENREGIDEKEVKKKAMLTYQRGDYKECINYCKQLLEFYDEPRAFVYARLGLCYMKLFILPKAIDCLTIATYRAPIDNMDFDFTQLIAKLRGEEPKDIDEKKPIFRMKENEFNSKDINNFFGINNISDISKYINESGLDVESACRQLEFSEEAINLIKLIYAREYFIIADFTRGDELLKSVEKSKDKAPAVKKYFEEIRKNRMFYQNREVSENRIKILPESVRR